MNYKPLGKSGLIVSEFALGTMLFGEGSNRGTEEKTAQKQIDYFLDSGGNHIDCADVYAGGKSEEIVGRAVRGKRENVVLATKVRFPMGEDPNNQGLSRRNIIKGVENSLRRLQTDHLDLYYMHCWDPVTPIEESLRTFDDLVTSGKIRYSGVSNFKAWQLMKALGISEKNGWVGFVAAQYQYSLVKRDIEFEFADLLATEGVGIVPWGPLGGGFLSGKYKPDQKPTDEGRIAGTEDHTEEAWERRNTEQNWRIVELVHQLAVKYEATVPQIALAWLKQTPNVSSVILGARTFEQLEDNMGAVRIKIDVEDMTRLNDVSALPELYPYRMIEAYAQREF